MQKLNIRGKINKREKTKLFKGKNGKAKQVIECY